jgi:hypothetical protein
LVTEEFCDDSRGLMRTAHLIAIRQRSTEQKEPAYIGTIVDRVLRNGIERKEAIVVFGLFPIATE